MIDVFCEFIEAVCGYSFDELEDVIDFGFPEFLFKEFEFIFIECVSFEGDVGFSSECIVLASCRFVRDASEMEINNDNRVVFSFRFFYSFGEFCFVDEFVDVHLSFSDEGEFEEECVEDRY